MARYLAAYPIPYIYLNQDLGRLPVASYYFASLAQAVKTAAVFDKPVDLDKLAVDKQAAPD